MHSALKTVLAALLTAGVVSAAPQSDVTKTGPAPAAQAGATQRIDLAERLAAGKLRAVNRDVTKSEVRADEFENPVDASVSPTDWVPLRVDVKGQTIQIYVGQVTSPTLEVRKLGTLDRGMVGLWTGNGSDGDFANVRITPSK